jgi:hypothetical protein
VGYSISFVVESFGSRGDDVKDLKTAINSLGILLTMIGIVMVYLYSPLNESVVDGGGAGTDFGAIERKQKCRNQLLRLGVYLVLMGSAAQSVSNFIPSGSSAAA